MFKYANSFIDFRFTDREKETLVVCFNGNQQSHGVWRHMHDALVNHNVLTFDVPGQGKSESDIKDTFERDRSIIHELIKYHLKEGQKLILLASSFGAFYAFDFAARNKDCVQKIIAISFTPAVSDKLKLVCDLTIEHIDKEQNEQIGDPAINHFGEGLDDNFKKLIKNQALKLTKKEINALRARSSFIRGLRHTSDFIDYEVLAGTPIHVLLGERDTTINLDDWSDLHFLDADIRIARGCFHFAHMENPILNQDLISLADGNGWINDHLLQQRM